MEGVKVRHNLARDTATTTAYCMHSHTTKVYVSFLSVINVHLLLALCASRVQKRPKYTGSARLIASAYTELFISARQQLEQLFNPSIPSSFHPLILTPSSLHFLILPSLHTLPSHPSSPHPSIPTPYTSSFYPHPSIPSSFYPLTLTSPPSSLHLLVLPSLHPLTLPSHPSSPHPSIHTLTHPYPSTPSSLQLILPSSIPLSSHLFTPHLPI